MLQLIVVAHSNAILILKLFILFIFIQTARDVIITIIMIHLIGTQTAAKLLNERARTPSAAALPMILPHPTCFDVSILRR